MVSLPPPIAKQLTPQITNEDVVEVLPDWDDVPAYDGDDEEELIPSPTRPALSIVPPQEKQSESVSVQEAITDENEHDAPTLTVAEIKEKWENIKRRIKTRKDGSMIAAILNDYTIVGVEGTRELPVVVLKALAKFHYDTLQKDDRRKTIEWGLKIELGQECQVRLLPPGQMPGAPGLPAQLPSPPPRDMGGRAANSGILTQPQQSAYRERVASPPPIQTPRKSPSQEHIEKQEPTNGSTYK